MQRTWEAGLEWDQIMDKDLQEKVTMWFDELQDLGKIKIPRCIRLDQDEKEADVQLHAFCDASEDAYGAVIYLRMNYSSGKISTQLVAAKTKVAPIKSTSIPRMELMGAVLAVRLAKNIAETYNIKSCEIQYWSDSQNVLWWIHGKSKRYKPFVGNRIAEIQTHSEPANWHHISTKSNPADFMTRGLSITELADCELWWKGPEFLRTNKDWKSQSTPVTIPDRDPEIKSKYTSTYTQMKEKETDEEINRLDPTRYSTWNKMVRVLAWVMRFLRNCRYKVIERKKEELVSEEEIINGELIPMEIKEAMNYFIKEAQISSFHEEYKNLSKRKPVSVKSRISCLLPTMDDDGIIRANTRIRNAEFLPFDTRYPIILPRQNHVTKLIIQQQHTDDNHYAGTNHTLSRISSKYSIIGAREVIKEVEKNCYECRRRKKKTTTQVMAPLPTYRLTVPLRAFINTATDYGGPFITIQGRGKKRAKRYLCLFTCLNTRAVHLEMSYNMDTDSFLNAFYRMVSRRGLPEKMVSDNGGNFVGADNELKELVKCLDKEKIKSSTANKGIQWNFNPPLAPHFGGAHESMIKSAKRAIYAILGNADINDEELHSAFVGAESLINSRPLTYQSSHPADDVPLTPNHFLHGQAGGNFAPESVDSMSFNTPKRWRRVQELVRHFWSRWIKEWLPSLNATKKWKKGNTEFEIGDVVLVMSTDQQRGHWKLAKIINVYPGTDNVVRVLRILVGRNEYIRSVNNLVRLEC